MSKHRILTLHGFCDSAQRRHDQMRSLIRSMKNIEFVFINSPFLFHNYEFLKTSNETTCAEIQEKNEATIDINEPRYQWISYKPDYPISRYNYDTIEQSIAYVVKYINENGPFDGLLGFSQGGIVCATMVIQKAFNQSENNSQLRLSCPILPDSIKYVILVGCPFIGDKTIQPLLETNRSRISLPTLHVSGSADSLVSTEMSKSLSKYFNPSQFHTHKGGHYCPSDSEFRKKLQDFIESATHP